MLIVFYFIFSHRRSEWKWAAERSAIASRWTWLQAQVSDLEYRIRQQSDTHRQIRSEKGDLIFESLQTQPVTCNSRTGEILNQEEKSGEKRTEKSNKPFVFQSSKFNQSLVNCILPPGLTSPMSSGKDTCQSSTQKSLNGLIDSNHNGKSVSTSDVASPTVKTDDKLLLENSESLATPTVPVDITCQAARCRPVKSYRKRKLFRTAGLHQLYRKATRLSTVKCHCYTPVVPCAMCGGRYNNTQTLDPDLMPLHERLSLLDPSFHPVLSFSQGEFLYFFKRKKSFCQTTEFYRLKEVVQFMGFLILLLFSILCLPFSDSHCTGGVIGDIYSCLLLKKITKHVIL